MLQNFNKKILIVALIILNFYSENTSAQKIYYKDGKFYDTKIIQNDTILSDTLPEFTLIVHKKRSRFQWRKYRRLIYNLKRVYPYVKIAGERLGQYNLVYLELDTEKEKREYAKQVEDSLLNEFEKDLRKLTISQGKLLVKLIDRETGMTSFEVVKEFRGNFSAHFWQTLARIFGNNLKVNYDPEGEDKEIEMLIEMLENGQL